jgi:hypothetical protein
MIATVGVWHNGQDLALAILVVLAINAMWRTYAFPMIAKLRDSLDLMKARPRAAAGGSDLTPQTVGQPLLTGDPSPNNDRIPRSVESAEDSAGPRSFVRPVDDWTDDEVVRVWNLVFPDNPIAPPPRASRKRQPLRAVGEPRLYAVPSPKTSTASQPTHGPDAA